MKKLSIIAALALVCSLSNAQEWDPLILEGANGHKYESYLTNDWYDNFFVGGAAGIGTRFTAGKYSDITKMVIDPMIDIYIMKWFTPKIGARLGYLGFSGSEGLDSYLPYQLSHSPFPYKLDRTGEYVTSADEKGTLSYGSFYIHGDFMWNLSTTFGGYKRNRFYNISVYVSGGYLKLYDNRTEGNKGLFSTNFDREFAFGAGAYNTFRITDRFVATADLRYTNHVSRYRTATGVRTNVPSLTIGLAYNLYKTNWTDVAAVQSTVEEAREATRAAEEKLAAIQKDYDEIKQELEDVEADYEKMKIGDDHFIKVNVIEYAELKKRAEAAGLVVYFHINKSELPFSELAHLSSYAQNCLADNPDHVFNVTGSADKGTGNEAINAKLSYARALYIKKILMEEHGVKAENIIIDNVVTDKHLDGAYDRCAIIGE